MGLQKSVRRDRDFFRVRVAGTVSNRGRMIDLIVDLLRPRGDVRLSSEHDGRIFERAERFHGCAALALRSERHAHVRLCPIDVRGVNGMLGVARE